MGPQKSQVSLSSIREYDTPVVWKEEIIHRLVDSLLCMDVYCSSTQASQVAIVFDSITLLACKHSDMFYSAKGKPTLASGSIKRFLPSAVECMPPGNDEECNPVATEVSS